MNPNSQVLILSAELNCAMLAAASPHPDRSAADPDACVVLKRRLIAETVRGRVTDSDFEDCAKSG
jgi:hypothetical protein